MTDTEIKQNLRFIAKYCKDEYNEIRVDELLLNALDLINRQQADNERLKKLLAEEETKYNECAKRFYTEAIKELAERLKENCKVIGAPLITNRIDNLLKEMAGDAE